MAKTARGCDNGGGGGAGGGGAPRHMLVLQNGLHGNPSHFEYLREQLGAAALPHGELHVFAFKGNAGVLATHDGIAAAGTRLADAIEAELARVPSLTQLSLVGYSLGGLISRYAAGLLLERDVLRDAPHATGARTVRPVHYISLASPHLGSRRPEKGWFNPLVSALTANIFGRTGRELMLLDGGVDARGGGSDDVEQPPLLVRMTEPGSVYMGALAMFERRTLFCNIEGDIKVPFCTSALVASNPYLAGHATLDPEARLTTHVVARVVMPAQPLADTPPALVRNDPLAQHINAMLNNVRTLEWHRVDCHFHGFFSHERIVCRSWIHATGTDVLGVLVQLLVPED